MGVVYRPRALGQSTTWATPSATPNRSRRSSMCQNMNPPAIPKSRQNAIRTLSLECVHLGQKSRNFSILEACHIRCSWLLQGTSQRVDSRPGCKDIRTFLTCNCLQAEAEAHGHFQSRTVAYRHRELQTQIQAASSLWHSRSRHPQAQLQAPPHTM